MDPDIPYLLLTPGPLTTSRTVRAAMDRDWCTWDDDYNRMVNDIRRRLVALAGDGAGLTAVLMQGSGTFSVEATIGSVLPPDGKLLVVNNGAYGKRIAQIAARLKIACAEMAIPETAAVRARDVDRLLANDPAITHVACVHCETTTGMLNPVADVGAVCAKYRKTFIVDAMSAFGGVPMTMKGVGAHFLISSANKCIQGVPGFGFVVADRDKLAATKGFARSLSLDLFDQWQEMETKGGKWRFTSPTHVVRAFAQALAELEEEGGVAARSARYQANHAVLVEGMAALGFRPLLRPDVRAPIITAFHEPNDPNYSFATFYAKLKARRFVIYPGKVSQAPTFRIGNIGHVFPDDMRQLVTAIGETIGEMGIRVC
jgi:2-aminoethylphosphonate-pyruvate transaminase